MLIKPQIINFIVCINIFDIYKSKLIRLLSLTVEKEVVIFSESFIRAAGLQYRNNNARDSVLWPQLQYYLNKMYSIWKMVVENRV